MRWIEAKIIFEFDDRELAADLIANTFYEFGLQGVVIEAPEAFTDEDWAGDAAGMPEEDAVIGYFPEDKKAPKKCELLEKKLQSLAKETGLRYRVNYLLIDETDWSESWKSYFWPAKVSANIVVKPTWRQYSRIADEIVVEIDPGMAFGTGTHPTTSLCIELMETYLKKGSSFLDVGTGSGILMVAAAKLGAEKLSGIDNDDVAVQTARKNLAHNRIDPAKYKVVCGNLIEGVDECYSMVVANISSDVIFKILDNVKTVLTDNGVFICSGLTDTTQKPITEKMQRVGFEILEIREKEAWIAIAGRSQ